MGVSDAVQPTLRDVDERGRAWRFEAMIDVAQHKDLVDSQGNIISDYFRLYILKGVADWETIIEPGHGIWPVTRCSGISAACKPGTPYPL